MKVFDKNLKLIYECNLKGDELANYFEKEVLIKKGYGSTINLVSFPNDRIGSYVIPYDIQLIIELAARKYDYLNGALIKPWEAAYGFGIIFTELSVGD